MSRTIIAALVGAVVGGGAVVLARTVLESETSATIVVEPASLMAAPGSPSVDVDRLLNASQNVNARAQTLEAIAEWDISQLPALVLELASKPQSPERDFALAMAVRRLAERDAGGTLAVLGQTYLDPRTAREVAGIVLEQLEPEAASVDVVLAALPQVDPYQFQFDAAALFADTSVEAALSYTLGLEYESQRRRALRAAAPRLIAEKAQTFAFIDGIDDAAVRAEFESTMLSELASDDIEAARALFAERHPESDNGRQAAGMRLVQELSLRSPAKAVALIEALDLERNYGWWRGAMARLARTDPEAGMAFAEQKPVRPFNRVRQTVATVLAEQNPDATIAWLRSLDPMPADLAEGVVSGIARVDPMRAIELGEELSVTGSLSGIDTLAQSASLVAERVLAVQDPVRRDQWLASLLAGWGRVDEVAATDWAIANADRLSPELFDRLGRARGGKDPAAALLETARLPAAAREAWVGSVMRSAMLADPVGALDWVRQFRGQPFYDTAAASVVSSGVWKDVAPVREVFDTLSEDRRAEVARRFATTWYGTDADAARAWATGLAAGAVRDQAVTGIIEYAGFQPADEALMDLYSSDTARAEAVVGMLDNIARRDPRTARKLVDDYVEDPALREQAELLLQGSQR